MKFEPGNLVRVQGIVGIAEYATALEVSRALGLSPDGVYIIETSEKNPTVLGGEVVTLQGHTGTKMSSAMFAKLE